MTIPVFTSHFSIAQSLLTLDEPGKAKAGAPVSVFDLSQSAGLKEVVLVDEKIDGFIAAYKAATKLGVKLCYGWKVVVCADMAVKDEASLGTQSKVIVFARDTQGYHDLLRLHNRATVDGFYYTPRLDWATLRALWTDRLIFALPWASSFIAKNVLTFSRIVPDLPATPWVFREVATELPFARLIDGAIGRYVKDNVAQAQDVKSVYYSRRSDMEAYMTLRAKGNTSKGGGATFNAPGIDHLSSDAFGFDSYLALCPPPTPSPTASP